MDVGNLKSNGPILSEGVVELKPGQNAGTPAVQLRLFQDFDSGADYVGLISPAALAAGSTDYVLPDAYPTVNGQALVATTGGTMSWATAGGGVFGSEHHYQEKTTLQTNGTSTYAEYTKLTTAALTAGTYRIAWSAVWNYSDPTDEFYLRVQVDDSVQLIDPANGGQMVEEPPSSSGIEQRLVRSGFRHITLGAGVHTVDIDFRASDGSDTARIYFGSIELFRVA